MAISSRDSSATRVSFIFSCRQKIESRIKALEVLKKSRVERMEKDKREGEGCFETSGYMEENKKYNHQHKNKTLSLSM